MTKLRSTCRIHNARELGLDVQRRSDGVGTKAGKKRVNILITGISQFCKAYAKILMSLVKKLALLLHVKTIEHAYVTRLKRKFV